MAISETFNNLSLFYKNNKYIINGFLILIFYTVFTILYFIYNPYNLPKDYKVFSIVISIVNYFTIIMGLYFIVSRKHLFGQDGGPSLFNFIYKLLILELIIFGSIIAIYALSYFFSYFKSLTSVLSLTIGILILIGIVAFIISVTNVENKINKINDFTFLGLIKNILFYLPCLLIQLIEFIRYQFSITTSVTWIILLIEVFLVLAYIYIPIIYKKLDFKKGLALIKKPLPLYNEYNLSSKYYLDNENDQNTIKNPKYNYRYSISCWFYINPQPPSAGYQFNSYSNVLNYGNKPIILYKNKTNTLKIKMLNNNALEEIVETNNVLLQKWNHIVINYDGGILDIFLNNELIKSVPGVVPYMNNDKIFVGSKEGLYGNITNLIYFKTPLKKSQITNIYNSNKNKNPPTF